MKKKNLQFYYFFCYLKCFKSFMSFYILQNKFDDISYIFIYFSATIKNIYTYNYVEYYLKPDIFIENFRFFCI